MGNINKIGSGLAMMALIAGAEKVNAQETAQNLAELHEGLNPITTVAVNDTKSQVNDSTDYMVTAEDFTKNPAKNNETTNPDPETVAKAEKHVKKMIQLGKEAKDIDYFDESHEMDKYVESIQDSISDTMLTLAIDKAYKKTEYYNKIVIKIREDTHTKYSAFKDRNQRINKELKDNTPFQKTLKKFKAYQNAHKVLTKLERTRARNIEKAHILTKLEHTSTLDNFKTRNYREI